MVVRCDARSEAPPCAPCQDHRREPAPARGWVSHQGEGERVTGARTAHRDRIGWKAAPCRSCAGLSAMRICEAVRAVSGRRQRTLLWRQQNGLCHWCNQPTRLLKLNGGKVPDDAATIDHLDSRLNPERGKHKGELRHVMACSKCNQQRARQEELATPIEVIRERAQRHPR